jgi:RNA polymerase sigma-70 factor (ECF subfamily)
MSERVSETFLRSLTRAQAELYAYILGLIADANAASDILQEANVVLWRKAEQFTEGTDFVAWAKRVAYIEVLGFRKNRGRDRHLFNDDLLVDLAVEMEAATRNLDVQLAALRTCIEGLPAEQGELIRKRYQRGAIVQRIAKDAGRSVGAISQSLYRIRERLLQCIERRLAAGEST